MFELDQAITEWRRKLLAAGIETPAVLDELESHLREHVAQQLSSGIDRQQAFETAVRAIGEAVVLKREFAKVNVAPRPLRKSFACICLVLVGFIVWMSGYTFSQMGFGIREQIVAFTAVLLSLAVACGWRLLVPFLPVIQGTGKRILIGSVCIISGFLCSSFFCTVILPRFENSPDHQIPAVGFWALLPISVLATVGLGLMMSAREREQWSMGKTRRNCRVAAGC